MGKNIGLMMAIAKAVGGSADPAVIEQAVAAWLNAHPEATTTVEDGSITEAKLAADVLAELGEIDTLKEAITTVEEDLGLIGEPTDYGTDHPLVINDGVGTVVDLEFDTAETFLVTNRNLTDAGTKTFTRTKQYSLPIRLPAGKYTVSAVVASADTDSNKCQVLLQDGDSNKGYAEIGRAISGERTYCTITASASFNKLTLQASDTYSHAAGDSATFTNIQLEAGESATDYVAYDGEVSSVTGTDQITLEFAPTYIYTNDQSDVHGSSEAGDAHPVIPDMQAEISALNPVKGKKILVFGDSIWGNDRTNGVADYVALYSGATIYNGAIGGTRITGDRDSYNTPKFRPFDGVNLIHAKLTNTWTDQDEKIDSVATDVPYAPSVLTMLKALDMSTIDIVILSYGINDFTGDKTIASVTSAFESAVSEILTSYPNIRIVIISPAWRMYSSGTVDGDVYENANNDTIRDMADGVVDSAKAHHVACINMVDELPWRAETAMFYLDNDKVHPNINGNMIYAHVVNGKLRGMY